MKAVYNPGANCVKMYKSILSLNGLMDVTFGSRRARERTATECPRFARRHAASRLVGLPRLKTA
jgi:hypothetical protein